MPNYYMIITTANDYECDVENNFECAGFPYRNRKSVMNMKPGDKIIFYITKKSVFTASVEVVGNYYYSEKPYWDDFYEIYPHRINTKPIAFISDIKKGVFIKEIWDDLEFIKNKGKWGSQVQGSFRKLSEHDFNIIENSIKEREL